MVRSHTLSSPTSAGAIVQAKGTPPSQRHRRYVWGRFRTAPIITLFIMGTPPHPPTEACMIHSKQHRGCGIQDPGTRGKHQTGTKNPWCPSTGCRVQNSGPRDPWLPVVKNSRLFAQHGHSTQCAPFCLEIAYSPVFPCGCSTLCDGTTVNGLCFWAVYHIFGAQNFAGWESDLLRRQNSPAGSGCKKAHSKVCERGLATNCCRLSVKCQLNAALG